MPAFGVDTYHGLTKPAGYAQEVSSDITCEVATLKNEAGRVVHAQPKPLRKQTVTIRCKGDAALSSVSGTAVDFSGITVVSAKVSETQDDFPTSEITGELYY